MGKANMQLGLVFLSIFLVFVAAKATYDQSQQHEPGTVHFVLVHGSCLGAWSWYKLTPLLRSSGHRVTAIDLGASGINPLQANALRSISDYFQPLVDLMALIPSDERVILVGHSLGGLAVSYAMERFLEKISVAVFVNALMPGPTLNVSTFTQESLKRKIQLFDSKYTYDDGPNRPPTTFIFGPVALSKQAYQLSPPEDVALATMLVRPLRLFSTDDMGKIIVLTKEKYGSIPRVVILSDADKLTDKDLMRWMIERNPPNKVEEIKGSDHMVMVSKHLQLHDHLLGIVQEYH